MQIFFVAAVCIAAVAATSTTPKPLGDFWWQQTTEAPQSKIEVKIVNLDDGYGSSGGDGYGGGSDGSETFDNGNTGSNQQTSGGSYGGGDTVVVGQQTAGGSYGGGSSQNQQTGSQTGGGSYGGGSSNQNQQTGSQTGGESYGGGSSQNQQSGSQSGGSYGGGSNQNQQSGNYNAGGNSGNSYVDDTLDQQIYGQSPCLHQCVPYFQCNSGEIINDGEGIIDLRIYEPGQGSDDLVGVGGSCPNILDVCCRNPYVPDPEPITPAPYEADKCGLPYDQAQDQIPDVRIHLNKTRHNFDNVAQFGAYPWMAAILKFDRYGDQDLNIYQCGGSLIDKQVILTAAHCVDQLDAQELKVRLGEWDTQSTQDHPNFLHEDYSVSKIVIHSRYYRKNVFNDIALLFLSEPVRLNYHIQTICLPAPGQNFDGQTCYASGWGKDNFGQEGNWQAILKEIDIPIVERTRCQEKFRTSRLGCNFCLHDTFLCAGGIEGKDTCTGDGGSPLVCYDSYNQNYVQAGVVSWGIGCGSDLPGAYVDVGRYVDWIEYQTNEYFSNIGAGSYTGAYSGNYKSSTGAVSNYYEGDHLFMQCKTTPTVYPIGHYCYRPPRPRPQQHRRPNPRPGSSVGTGNYGSNANQQGSAYNSNQQQSGGNYGSNANQQGSGYNANQQQTTSGYNSNQQNTGSGYSGQQNSGVDNYGAGQLNAKGDSGYGRR